MGKLLSRLHVEHRPDRTDVEFGPVDSRSGCDDSIVGLGILLCKFKALTPTLGAAIPVKIQWALAVETLDQLLCDTSLLIDRKLVKRFWLSIPYLVIK